MNHFDADSIIILFPSFRSFVRGQDLTLKLSQWSIIKALRVVATKFASRRFLSYSTNAYVLDDLMPVQAFCHDKSHLRLIPSVKPFNSGAR